MNKEIVTTNLEVLFCFRISFLYNTKLSDQVEESCLAVKLDHLIILKKTGKIVFENHIYKI